MWVCKKKDNLMINVCFSSLCYLSFRKMSTNNAVDDDSLHPLWKYVAILEGQKMAGGNWFLEIIIIYIHLKNYLHAYTYDCCILAALVYTLFLKICHIGAPVFVLHRIHSKKQMIWGRGHLDSVLFKFERHIYCMLILVLATFRFDQKGGMFRRH